eukprot:scaffold201470_cov26-Prasinocladus_malaysianus.AAC.1
MGHQSEQVSKRPCSYMIALVPLLTTKTTRLRKTERNGYKIVAQSEVRTRRCKVAGVWYRQSIV